MSDSAADLELPQRPPTMGDVAKRVRASRQLVGLVFRNETGVSADMRRRILDAAAEIGYQPNLAAQTLRQRASRHLGVVFSPFHSFDLDLVDGLYSAAATADYRIVLCALTSTHDTKWAINEVLGHRCEAALVIGPVLSDEELQLASGQLPVVMIGGGDAPHSECDSVRSAGDQGIADAVRHLWRLGHRDIAYLYGSGMPSASLREHGYTTAITDLGGAPRIVRTDNDYTEECGARAARMLLQEPTFPTAVVACNDHAAVGFLHTCQQAGLRIPDDVSVVGFDDSRAGRLSYVQLTTVHQDASVMAQASVDAALGRIQGRREPIETVTNTRLIIRATTAAPRAAALPRTSDAARRET